MNEGDFEGLRHIAVDSFFWRLAVVSARAGHAAWDDSRTAGLLRRLAALIEDLAPAEQVRAVGICAVAMGAGYLAFLWVAPAYVAPGLPHAWIEAATLFALAVAALARPLTTAWDDSAIAAAVRRRR